MSVHHWQPNRRDALYAIAMICAGGCSSAISDSGSSSLSAVAARFKRQVVVGTKECRLHPSYAQSVLLPSDYSKFLTTFGGGTFSDGRFSFVVGDLTHKGDSTVEDLFSVLHDRDYHFNGTSFKGFREIPGIIPWGHDFQETTFYWVANHDDPDNWPVVINTAADNLLLHSHSMTDFLASCLLDHVSFYSIDSQFDQRALSFTPARNG